MYCFETKGIMNLPNIIYFFSFFVLFSMKYCFFFFILVLLMYLGVSHANTCPMLVSVLVCHLFIQSHDYSPVITSLATLLKYSPGKLGQPHCKII